MGHPNSCRITFYCYVAVANSTLDYVTSHSVFSQCYVVHALLLISHFRLSLCLAITFCRVYLRHLTGQRSDLVVKKASIKITTCHTQYGRVLHYLYYFHYFLSVDSYLGGGATDCHEILCADRTMSLMCLLLLWGQYPKHPKNRHFWPLESHLIAIISKMVNRSLVCQLGLNIS